MIQSTDPREGHDTLGPCSSTGCLRALQTPSPGPGNQTLQNRSQLFEENILSKHKRVISDVPSAVSDRKGKMSHVGSCCPREVHADRGLRV